MSKEIITRRASDNKYLHKDFHIALNYGIDYLLKKYCEDAVKDYLRQFTISYYAPLTAAINRIGLKAIKEHYEKIYKTEDAVFDMQYTDDELIIHLSASPAVSHIKENGHSLSRLYGETVKTVMTVLCEKTPYKAKILEYNDDNGAYKIRFYRRNR